MAKLNQDAAWVNDAEDMLDVSAQRKYAAYKAAYVAHTKSDLAVAMKAARVAFEQQMIADAELPAGKKMIFNHNYGKLAFAIIDDDGKQTKAKVAKGSLADYVKAQVAAGARA